ncbi:MAG: hypothetical protein HY903_12165 [Deltaproteobacteria bacterium]|nr:hypothetical protein [Deltaproteobacteria bacterium]
MVQSRLRWDLLSSTFARGSRWRARSPLLFQALALAAAIALAVNGWSIGTEETAAARLVLRKTNLTTLAVWGLWWPLMILLAITLGRVWCTACPLELACRAGGAAARHVGWRRLVLPRFMRSGWAVFLAYLVLQVLVAAASIHRVPHFTSIFLALLGGLALVSGLIFAAPHAFCRGLCPARALLSVYGRCTPRAGVRRNRELRPFEAAFVVAAAGFVTHELVGEVAWLENLFHVVPEAVHRQWPALAAEWLEVIWFLAVFPTALWALVAAVARTFGNRGGLKATLLSTATGAAPVIALGHAAKAMSKLGAWAGYLPLALQDPNGIETLHKISSGALSAPVPLVGLSMPGLLTAAAVVLVGWRSWRWARATVPGQLPALRAGFLVAAVFYTSIMVVWMEA